MSLLVQRHESRTDVDRRGFDNFSAPAHRKLGRAPTNVDVQHGLGNAVVRFRARAGTRTVRGHDRLKIRTCRSRDELSRLPGEECGDGLCIPLFRRLPGEDDRSGLDGVRGHAGILVDTINKSPQLFSVNGHRV